MPFCPRPWVKSDAIALSLQNCPTWNVVGGADRVEFLNMAKSMHLSQQSVGAESTLTVIPNVGHQVWELYYNNPIFYHWLVRQTRPTNVMKAQAELFYNLQTEENSLFSVGANITMPERDDNAGLIPGWDAQWYNDMEFKTSLAHRTVPKIALKENIEFLSNNIPDKFSVRYNGWIKIEKLGFYSFTINSSSGARLFLGNQKLINERNMDENNLIEKSTKIRLKPGWHKIIVEYYQNKNPSSLSVLWSGPDKERCAISEKDIYCEPIK